MKLIDTFKIVNSIILLPFIVGCNTMVRKDLYFYNSHSFKKLFQKIGYNDFYCEKDQMYVSRNSEGTSLRFINAGAKRAIIIHANGTIKEMNIPSAPAWFNDNDELIAWFNWEKSNQMYVYYSNGMKEKRSFGPFCGPDPSGSYFIKYPVYNKGDDLYKFCRTKIYSIDKPDIPLYEVPVCGDLNTQIYFDQNYLYLFGEDYYKKTKDIRALYVLQINSNQITEVKKMYIERPKKSTSSWIVIDYCTWNGEVLMKDVNEFPWTGTYYVYNVKTNKLIKIRNEQFLSSVREFYLKSDVIKDFLDNR